MDALLFLALSTCALLPLALAASDDSAPPPDADDVKKKARETIDAASDYLSGQKEESLQAAEQRLQDLRADLRRWKSDVTANAKFAQLEGRRELETRLDAAEQTVQEARQKAETTWAQVKPELRLAFHDLERAYRKVREALK